MVSHREVAEPQGEGIEGVEVRPEVWMELLPEVLGTEVTEVRREAEVSLTDAQIHIFKDIDAKNTPIDRSKCLASIHLRIP